MRRGLCLLPSVQNLRAVTPNAKLSDDEDRANPICAAAERRNQAAIGSAQTGSNSVGVNTDNLTWVIQAKLAAAICKNHGSPQCSIGTERSCNLGRQ